MLRRPLILALAAALLAPAAAHAGPRHADPLADVAPLATTTAAAGPRFRDRVVTGAAVTARAAQLPSSGTPYRTSDGHTVRVALGPAYAADADVAQSYVDFLATLPHGAELDLLAVYVGTPAEVTSKCGASPELHVLACYLPARNLMIVPGEQPASGSGVTVSYIVAHEYGHHVANHRSNAPFDALDFGPKRWSSQANVCANTLAGRLAPGDEGRNYAANPGEAWAETFAQLRYPDMAWTFTSLLRPTQANLAAARQDVTQPWTSRRTQTFTGRLGAANHSDRHTFRLSLDGALTLRLDGPDGANYDLSVSSDGKREGATHGATANDGLRFRAACVRDPETLAVTVTRRSGAGPYTLRVLSAG